MKGSLSIMQPSDNSKTGTLHLRSRNSKPSTANIYNLIYSFRSEGFWEPEINKSIKITISPTHYVKEDHLNTKIYKKSSCSIFIFLILLHTGIL